MWAVTFHYTSLLFCKRFSKILPSHLPDLLTWPSHLSLFQGCLVSAWRRRCCMSGVMGFVWFLWWWSSVWPSSGSEVFMRWACFASRDRPVWSKSCRRRLMQERGRPSTGTVCTFLSDLLFFRGFVTVCWLCVLPAVTQTSTRWRPCWSSTSDSCRSLWFLTAATRTSCSVVGSCRVTACW